MEDDHIDIADDLKMTVSIWKMTVSMWKMTVSIWDILSRCTYVTLAEVKRGWSKTHLRVGEWGEYVHARVVRHASARHATGPSYEFHLQLIDLRRGGERRFRVNEEAPGFRPGPRSLLT